MSWSNWIIVAAACGLVVADARPAAAVGRGPVDESRSISLLYIADLHAQLEPHRDLAHMETVRFLKNEHDMGHGHANAIVGVFRAKRGL